MISMAGVKSLLSYQYIPDSESIYKNVYKIAPGQILIYQNQKIKKINIGILILRKPLIGLALILLMSLNL